MGPFRIDYRHRDICTTDARDVGDDGVLPYERLSRVAAGSAWGRPGLTVMHGCHHLKVIAPIRKPVRLTHPSRIPSTAAVPKMNDFLFHDSVSISDLKRQAGESVTSIASQRDIKNPPSIGSFSGLLRGSVAVNIS